MICNNCLKFKHFGDKCYFYFDKKKECSQFINKGENENEDLADLL